MESPETFDTYGREVKYLNPQRLDATEYGFAIEEPTEEKPANLLMSKVEGSDILHRPVLDIDFPARLIPSSTEGHFHLYLDGVVLTSGEMNLLLKTLAEVGIIEHGYANASISRGATAVRLPWVRKPKTIGGDPQPPKKVLPTQMTTEELEIAAWI